MSIENVKYLCIGRINDQKILVDYIPDKRTVAFREDVKSFQYYILF